MAVNGEALNSLKATDLTQFLAPNPALSQTARAALQSLFSSIRPFTPKSPFDRLLVDGFDTEQIWQQSDLQSQPLISSLRRDLKRLETNPAEIKLKMVGKGREKVLEAQNKGSEEESDGLDDELDEFDEEDDEEDQEQQEEEDEDEDEDDEQGEESENENEDKEEGEDSEGEDEGNNEIEDGFFKIKDLKKSLEESEAREYGLGKSDKKKKKKKKKGGDDDDDDEDEEDELGDFEIGDDEDEEDTDKFARYEDFYGGKKEKPSKQKSKLVHESEELEVYNEQEDEDEAEDGEDDDDEDQEESKQEDVKVLENQKPTTLSTHEKKLQQLQTKIEQMEKANLEPKTWTMQGEVTAERRPKNSALEVDLDFEHNVRPPPVITEEVTASIEDIIRKRIEQGNFDDVQKAPTLPTKAPREVKELDENKSQKGLAEVYEEEYVQKTNVAFAPLSVTDKQKEEASALFKKLCLKLDALSHFHFTPKPVIEDMSIQSNVPALAMEEIAPVAVSDAAMLAPEEVFSGKGDIKEEAELTQAERKRRRASKKRKYKAREAKRSAKKPRESLNDAKEG